MRWRHIISGCRSVRLNTRLSVRSPKYHLSTHTLVCWSIRPTVTVFNLSIPCLERFWAFPGKHMKETVCNLACWCIMVTFRTSHIYLHIYLRPKGKAVAFRRSTRKIDDIKKQAIDKRHYFKRKYQETHVYFLEAFQTSPTNRSGITTSLGGTARWLQLQPSSAWPRPTVSAFQYFRWCALTKPALSHFLCRIYSLSKEEAL